MAFYIIVGLSIPRSFFSFLPSFPMASYAIFIWRKGTPLRLWLLSYSHLVEKFS